MGKEENFKGNTKATQFPHNDPTKGGRKPSIRNQLKELLTKNGKLKVAKENIISIEHDGSVIIKMPTEMQLAMKLKQIAMGGKNNNTLKAIQMIMEQIDGKPKQSIELETGKNIQVLSYNPLINDEPNDGTS